MCFPAVRGTAGRRIGGPIVITSSGLRRLGAPPERWVKGEKETLPQGREELSAPENDSDKERDLRFSCPRPVGGSHRGAHAGPHPGTHLDGHPLSRLPRGLVVTRSRPRFGLGGPGRSGAGRGSRGWAGS